MNNLDRLVSKRSPLPSADVECRWFCGAVLVALSLGVAALAITTRSFWTDEACTAIKATQPSLSKWWGKMLSGGSDLQMPCYMIYVWLWAKVFGHSEWWLRAANLPWLALGLLAIPRRQFAFLAVVTLSPFVWFYLDEARPYAMQIGCGLLVIGALWGLAQEPAPLTGCVQNETLWAGCFWLGLLLQAASSMLAIIWAAATLGCAWVWLGRARAVQLLRRHWVPVSVFGACLAALACYYAWTLSNSAQASTGRTGLGNVVFAAYELLGFAGLGPGRLDLRQNILAAFKPFVPVLCLYAGMTGIILITSGAHLVRHTPRRIWFGVACFAGMASAALLAAGVVKHVRILARHAAPLAPLILLVLAVGVGSLWRRGGIRRFAAVVFLLLSLASAASLRLAPRHAKDEYRQAAALACAALARGEIVWWAASVEGGAYYGLPVATKNTVEAPGRAWEATRSSEELLTRRPVPQLVVLAKPDYFDESGSLRAFLNRGGYQLSQSLPALTLWRKPASPP